MNAKYIDGVGHFCIGKKLVCTWRLGEATFIKKKREWEHGI